METEEERQIRRRKRIEEMKREKRRVELMQKWGVSGISLAVLAAAGIWIGSALFPPGGDSREETQESETRVVSLQDFMSKEDEAEGKEAEDSNDTGEEDRQERKTGQGKNGGDGAEEEGGIAGDGGEESLAAGNSEVISGEETIPMTESTGLTTPFEAHDNENTIGFDETIISKYGVLIDVADQTVLAQKGAHERMNPASMTKILTLLVAVEHLTPEDLEKTEQITIDITDYCYVNECSVVGYALDEAAPVKDLLYGTILPSGADASMALAKYVAGSQEAFVELMNEKVAELGLADSTHFTNCVGLYDENHYTTAYDMAVMLKAATDNELCREVLSAHSYVTTSTEEHPEGMVLSNWFLRRIEDKDTHGAVLCGKTGYVDEAGSCAASLARGSDGREYICVTAGSSGSWNCIGDQVALYQSFLAGEDTSQGTEEPAVSG